MNLPNEPVIAGNKTVMTTEKGQKLFFTTLLPKNSNITSIPVEDNIGQAEGESFKFRLLVEARGGPRNVRFLNVLQGANPGAVANPVTLIQSSSGIAFAGVFVNSTVVLFPVNLGTAFTYTNYTSPAARKHLITGLAPGGGYDAVVRTEGQRMNISISAGTKYHADSSGMLTLSDTVAPTSITNLTNRSFATSYINWTWNDSTSLDFTKVMVYINGIFKTNVSKGKKYFNATGFLPNTTHRISTRTMDTSGNVNLIWINHTARTARDYTPPASITNLINRTYARTHIIWTWKDPSTYDFTKVMVYINGVFRTNITKGKQYYNATGLKNNTYYMISTHTVDISGNINQLWRNHTARTRT